MKCPKCGAWSSVLETRPIRGGLFLVRRRRCANEHRFTTHEVTAPQWAELQEAGAVPQKRGPPGREL